MTKNHIFSEIVKLNRDSNEYWSITEDDDKYEMVKDVVFNSKTKEEFERGIINFDLFDKCVRFEELCVLWDHVHNN